MSNPDSKQSSGNDQAPIDFRAFRAILRALQSPSEQCSPISKCLRGIVMVPVFGCCLILLKLRAAIGRPVIVNARTDFGAMLRCRMPDLVQMYIALFGVWEPDQTRYIQKNMRAGRVFVDVGANIGYYSVLAAPLTGNDGSVLAIDASADIHRLLQENLKANGQQTTVRTLNRAVAEQEGTIRVYKGPDHNIGLTTTVPNRGFSAEVDIEAKPLGDLSTSEESSRTQMIKIDVEGGEPAVLAGMTEFLAACPDDVEILIELSPSWWADAALKPEVVLKPLFDLGFNAYAMPNNYWPWRYMWPHDVGTPRRYRGDLTRRVKRIDLVLSRRDVEELVPVNE